MQQTKSIIESAAHKLNDALVTDNPLIIKELLFAVESEIHAAQNILDIESFE